MATYADNIRTPPRTLTEVEQRRLLKATGEHKAGFRDHVLFSLALGTGLREHELLALDVGDVFDSGKARRRLVRVADVDSPRAKAGHLTTVVEAHQLGGAVVERIEYLGERLAQVLPSVVGLPRPVLTSAGIDAARQRAEDGPFITGEGRELGVVLHGRQQTPCDLQAGPRIIEGSVLLQMNTPDVVLPILGWFFAAPLKPRI